MVKDNDLHITIPSLFKCPISLDVMKSPVSLCTGVTYDRSSIQRWLDSGHNTCPATMQVLQTKDLVPNHTLQRLIRIWSDSVQTHPESNSLTQLQVMKLINQLKKSLDENSFVITAQLTSFTVESGQNRKFLAGVNGFVPFLIEILSKQIRNVYFSEKIIQLCSLILEDYEDKQKLARLTDKEFQSSMLILLQHGSADSKMATARVLELLSVDLDSSNLSELLKIVSNNRSNLNTIDAILSCLVSSSTMAKRIRVRLVQLGAVKVLGKMLLNSDLRVSIIEKVMKILEMITACKEGRKEICENEECIEAIVKKLLKVSNVATEHGVTILWSFCCLFRDKKAQSAVIKSNGLAKILLLMQSNCSPAVRQMAGDMLKIFRVNSKSCLSSYYDTKTTHIMPF